jgi:hypothetical protein
MRYSHVSRSDKWLYYSMAPLTMERRERKVLPIQQQEWRILVQQFHQEEEDVSSKNVKEWLSIEPRNPPSIFIIIRIPLFSFSLPMHSLSLC